MRVKLEDVCKRIYAGGDVPKDRYSEVKTDEYSVPIYANAEKDEGLYGYTDKAREKELSITVAARGTIGFTSIRREPFLPVVRLITVVPDTKKVSERYLYYVLKNCKSYSTGTSIPQLTVPDIKKKSFELCNIHEQEEIADRLDKANEIIQLRKKKLQLLEDLIKARFVEMFGDPIQNPKRYLKETINKHINLISGYPFKSEQYVDEGINICGGLIIMPQKIKWKECVHWSSVDGFEDYLLEENDIVMALDRPWISEGFKIAKVDAEHLPALLIQRTARIRAVDINQDYLYYCFINGGFDKHSNVTGSLVPHISAKDIRSFEVLIPPIELQEQFAAFVHQVDKSKLLSLIKLLEQLITYLYNVFIIYRQDKGEEVENHE